MTHTVTLTVRPEPVLLPRVTVLLRKYDVQINRVQRETIAGANQETITLELQPLRDNFAVAMKKLERLVPVVQLKY